MKPVPQRHSRILDALLIAAFAVGSLLTSAHAAFTPRDPATGVAVIYWPWTDAKQALELAVQDGARFVRFGGASFIVVVVPEAPDYITRVRASGALFVADPQAIAACFSVVSRGGVQS
jgi:hypothetical protein